MSEVSAHERFMEAALQQAEMAANAGEFPVGCVLVHKGKVIAEGHRKNSVGRSNEIDHAEIIALRHLITHREGGELEGVILYSTMEPCLMCFSALILNNIRTIVYGYEDAMGGATKLALQELAPLYADMSVEIVPHVLRERCLSLFKAFFRDPRNDYWKDSLLANYTLAQ